MPQDQEIERIADVEKDSALASGKQLSSGSAAKDEDRRSSYSYIEVLSNDSHLSSPAYSPTSPPPSYSWDTLHKPAQGYAAAYNDSTLRNQLSEEDVLADVPCNARRLSSYASAPFKRMSSTSQTTTDLEGYALIPTAFNSKG